MIKQFIFCAYEGCDRTEEVDDYDDQPPGWGGHKWDGAFCPRHFNRYVAWTLRKKHPLVSSILDSIYAPEIARQLKTNTAFVIPKGKPGDVVTFKIHNG